MWGSANHDTLSSNLRRCEEKDPSKGQWTLTTVENEFVQGRTLAMIALAMIALAMIALRTQHLT